METNARVTTKYVPGNTYDDLESTRAAAAANQPEYMFGEDDEYGVPLGIDYLRKLHEQLSSKATWPGGHNMRMESWD